MVFATRRFQKGCIAKLPGGLKFRIIVPRGGRAAVIAPGESQLSRRACHIDDGAPRRNHSVLRQAVAATDTLHASNARSLKIRCVEDVVRWRQTLNVL